MQAGVNTGLAGLAATAAAGTASTLVGASPGHVAIVAGSTAAVVLAGAVPWSRLGGGHRGGDQIDAQLLGAMVRAYQSVSREFSRDLSERFGIAEEIALDTTIKVILPTGEASGVAEAIDALDFAWRLGVAIADVDPAILPSTGFTSLAEWMLLEPEGLTIIYTGTGSFTIHLRDVPKKLILVVECLAVAASISGYNAQTLGAAISAHGKDSTGAPCVMQLSGNLHESVPVAMRRQFGKQLPLNCQVVVDVTTPDGALVQMRYTTPPAEPRL